MANYLFGRRWGTRFLFCCVVLAGSLGVVKAQSQSKFWVVFQENRQAPAPAEVSPAARRNRTLLQLALAQPSDAPVPPAYLDSLARRGISVSATSKWLCAAAVTASPDKIRLLKNAPWVKEIRPITGYLYPTRTLSGRQEIEQVGKAIAQLKPEALLGAGLTGEGITIGVIDAGFYKATQLPELQPIFATGRVLAHKDFVNPAAQHPYTHRESLLDNHGAEVLLRIGGYDPILKILTGLAPQANFVLARTDHGARENRLEEEYFVRALEWMDSLGVRLVNASLGYATGFDDQQENYRPDQMDGSSFIARAVQMAVEQKGMTILVSAGNDGGRRRWQTIGTPADAPGALTVGATGFHTWTRQSYSGTGPAFLPYLKPDLACYAAEGTSFSAPIITGLAACLLQANPSLTNQELTDILRQSGHLYPYGNTFVGYGVPNASRALYLALKPGIGFPPISPTAVQGKSFTLKVEQNRAMLLSNGGIVVFRKSSAWQVLKQQRFSTRIKKIKLKRLPGETHTTLQIGPKVVELEWQ